MSTEAAITVEDLRVVRGGRDVLHGISTSVRRGSVTGLLGPSGCGKTTLMRAIVGVQVVASGAVDGARAPRRRRRPALAHRVRDAGAVDLRSTSPSSENLRYFAAILGAGPDRIARSDRHGRPARPRAPAGGIALRRPALARLAGRRRCSATRRCSCSTSRPSASTRCCAATCGARSTGSRRRGTTLLVSSHVMDEAAACDELVLMRDGAVLDHEHARRAAPTDRRAGPRRRLPGRHRGGRAAGACDERRGDPRDRRGACSRRSAATRARSRCCSSCRASCWCCCRSLFEHQRGDASSGSAPPLLRALPVHRDVPRHVDRHAARADHRDPRAADDAAPGQGRPPGRLRRSPSVRWRRCRRSSICGVGFLRPRARLPARRLAGRRCSRSSTRCWAWRSGLFASAFAQTRVPGRAVHAGVRAAPAAAVRPVRPARRDGRLARGDLVRVLPLTYAFDALARATSPAPPGGALVADVAVVVAVTVAALGLGALTLRRRTP